MLNYEYFKLLLTTPDREKLAKSNGVFMVVCLTTAAVIGSAASIYAVLGILYALFLVMRGTFKLRVDRPAQLVAFAFLAYFAAELISGLVNPGIGTFPELMSVALFLGFLPLISLMVITPASLLDKVEISSAIVAVVSAFAAAGSSIAGEERIELAAGNAGVLAVLASVLLLINLSAIFRRGQKYWQYGLAGAMAAILVILLTGMRALLPVIFILPVLAIVLKRHVKLLDISRNAQASIALGLVLISVSAYPVVSWRLVQLSRSIHAIDQGNYSSSVGQRLILWEAGYKLAIAKPVFGYGPGNVSKVMIEGTASARGGPIGFSHFHNAFLNETIRAGLVGLIAMLGIFIVPLIVVLKAERKGAAGSAATILLGTQIIYMFSGLTGIMLGHDILDSLYLCVTVFCVYIAYPKDNTVDIEL